MKIKKHGWFYKITLLLFIIFMGLYISSESGYYESQVGSKVALTEDAMKRFESDVASGEIVDVKDYVTDEYVDYSNSFTDFGDNLSELVEEFISSGFEGLWDAIKVLFL